ncbi:hypothetical protein O6H91_04G014200 [Diphasiastrum complanatum]|uniref:Uncharacterized protein n=1 Tax=Diphasiastrum complanatum TaxID=34168 RepID=A0ACC2DUE7_DIPCM|nr:hypothetical protein O6H91_04G014200 [Diphasiastrum complanatum]
MEYFRCLLFLQGVHGCFVFVVQRKDGSLYLGETLVRGIGRIIRARTLEMNSLSTGIAVEESILCWILDSRKYECLVWATFFCCWCGQETEANSVPYLFASSIHFISMFHAEDYCKVDESYGERYSWL